MNYIRSAYTYLFGMNLVYACVIGLLIKSIAVGINYPDFLITIPALSFEAYKLFLASKRPDPVRVSEEVQKNLDNITSRINALTLEKNAKQTGTTRYF
jgi:hypothetical protein